MRIRVLAFATAAQALGREARDWEIAEGATVADLGAALAADRPELAAQLGRIAWAVDGRLARPEQVLTDRCEVALLPPVSGG